MNNNRGFTLLEILISMALVATVVVMVITAINLARRGETKAAEREQLLQIERFLYTNIVIPLRGIYPFYRRDEKGRPVLRFSGETDSISFVTTNTEPWRTNLANMPGLRWMKFYVDADELKMKEGLFFVDEPEESAEEKILYKGIDELRFEYLDPDEDIWTDNWPSDKNTLPRALKVRLRFIYKDRTVTLPPIIVYLRTSRSPFK